MKKLKFNSTLEHKSPGYAPYQIEVEMVIVLYGREFEKMKDFPICVLFKFPNSIFFTKIIQSFLRPAVI